MSRPPLPPFDTASAALKARMAEDAWNTRDPERVCLAHAVESRWRNRDEFPQGRAELRRFLERKWTRELDYRLIKELWVYDGHRIAAIRLRVAQRCGELVPIVRQRKLGLRR